MRDLALRLALTLAAALLPAAASAGERLTGSDKNVLRNETGAGGAPASGTGLKLNSRIGAAGAASFAGGSFKVAAGLMNTAAQPGTITELVAVSKATGTIDLSWTAPGRDGFEGDVAAGYYRIDYSSEAVHLFSPTTYQIQLATSVVAGTTHSFQLTNLEPNTTYYVKVYLADERRYFAEDSKRLDEATYANIPVNPFFSDVQDKTVTISWLLPAGGAEGFDLQASTTNFGGLFPGGTVVSSETPNGLLLSLKVTGLLTNTTYFFKVASLNWQGQKSFTTVISTRTRIGFDPLPVAGLGTETDDLGRTLRLSWSNPVFTGMQGVLVLVSTSASTNQVVDGASFTPGQVLADAAVVKSTAVATEFRDSGLTLDTTYFYHIYTQGDAIAPYTYSVVVSTAIFLDLPPNTPAGIARFMSVDKKQVALSWKPVVSNRDGSLFASTSAPRGVELNEFEIYRSTGLVMPSWVRVTTLPVTASFYSEQVPDPDRVWYYRITAADTLQRREHSLVIDTDRSFYVVAPDQVSRYRLPPELAAELLGERNAFASDLVIRVSTQSATGEDRIFKSLRFDVAKLPGGELVPDFRFSKADGEVALHYDVAGGFVIPSDLAPAALAAEGSGTAAAPAAEPSSRIRAGEADKSLAMYWHNGQKYVKLFGKVDTAQQVVKIQSSMPGGYQVRGVVRAAGFDFDLSGISNKAITPNADGRNDQVVFRFDNPRDSAFSGDIFDVTGARIASMAAGPVQYSLQWDGRANGRAVPGGVYVWQIRGEGKTFNGTVVVIR